ncbi:hypothetical protein ACUYOF_06895 [Photobacterium ganghwense]|uniref:hypothetical protein n=1 Tax=Photobacterium ganghwense TaxID=320778 RepID=UPI004055C6D6
MPVLEESVFEESALEEAVCEISVHGVSVSEPEIFAAGMSLLLVQERLEQVLSVLVLREPLLRPLLFVWGRL